MKRYVWFLSVSALLSIACAQPSVIQYDSAITANTSMPVVVSRDYMAVIEFPQPVERVVTSRTDLIGTEYEGSILFVYGLLERGSTDLFVWAGGQRSIFKVNLSSDITHGRTYLINRPEEFAVEETFVALEEGETETEARPASVPLPSLLPRSPLATELRPYTLAAMKMGQQDGTAVVTYLLNNLTKGNLELADLNITVAGKKVEFIQSEGPSTLASNTKRVGRIEVEADAGDEITLTWTLRKGGETFTAEQVVGD